MCCGLGSCFKGIYNFATYYCPRAPVAFEFTEENNKIARTIVLLEKRSGALATELEDVTAKIEALKAILNLDASSQKADPAFKGIAAIIEKYEPKAKPQAGSLLGSGLRFRGNHVPLFSPQVGEASDDDEEDDHKTPLVAHGAASSAATPQLQGYADEINGAVEEGKRACGFYANGRDGAKNHNSQWTKKPEVRDQILKAILQQLALNGIKDQLLVQVMGLVSDSTRAEFTDYFQRNSR